MKILLVQLKRAGDVLVTTPAIEALRSRYPDAQIDFLTEKPYASLLGNYPGLRTIQIYDKDHLFRTAARLRKERYDWFIDFLSTPRSAMIGLLSGARRRAGYAVRFWGMSYHVTVPRPRGGQSVVDGKFTLLEKLFGPWPTRPPRRLYLTPTEKAWADTVIPAAEASKKIVGIVPTTRQPTRKWLGSSFVQVAKTLQAQGHPIWFFWGPGEEAEVTALADQVPGSWKIPKTNFREMASLLSRCAVVVTNNSGPMHLAISVETPTVSIHGPTDPRNWNPVDPRFRVMQAKDVACLGCNLNKCPTQHECMTHLPPEEVLSVCREILS